MKKKILLLLLVLLTKQAWADEGMWLPYLLGQQVYNDMVRNGLKLSKEQIYSINKASLKDAVVLFGTGCTGEIISLQGLVLTNQHCGYNNIANASNTAHDYLKNGFYAHNRQQEIPTGDLSVQFLVSVIDITPRVTAALTGLSRPQQFERQHRLYSEITDSIAHTTGYEASVVPIFNDSQFLLFTYQRYKDIRLVATPPEDISNFGGEAENWQWPRQSGDFAMFRIYADKNGNPAPYSPDNVPLKPRYSLPISVKGVNENDYTMILGYPGTTNRYEVSYAVKLKANVENPAIVLLRGMRSKYIYNRIILDSTTRRKLAPEYIALSNSGKFFEGETAQLKHFDVVGHKQKQEAAFEKWAKGTPYENVLKDYAIVYQQWEPYAQHRIYLFEAIAAAPVMAFAAELQPLMDMLAKPQVPPAQMAQALSMADQAHQAFLNREDSLTDLQILATSCQLFYKNIPKDQHPAGLYEHIEKYGSLNDENTYRQWAHDLMTHTMLLNNQQWKDFLAHPAGETLHADPAFAYFTLFRDNYISKFLAFDQQFSERNAELRKLYLKGLMQMQPNRNWYPDANNSMRLTYGKVKSYQTTDSVKLDSYATMRNVMDKYKPGDIAYNLPPQYIDLYKKKAFGPYADPVRKDIVTSFITTNDITGGNSGSPVLNAKGQLIGLAFDTNYEGLDHKLQFEQGVNRTICVDIRYILWCVDKLGGASNIINEIQLVN